MNLFFTADIRGERAWFSEEEARHVLQVLRKKEGDELQFVDGRGGWHQAIIEETGKRHFVAKITVTRQDEGKDFSLHLAVAPTKNIERFEWLLEKTTEIGVDQITPLRCEHSERGNVRLDRLEKILLSAMKQSLRSWLPKLNELTDFEAFVKSYEMQLPMTSHPSLITPHFIAHCQAENLPHLKNNCPPGAGVTVLIGPEGDFSLAEIALANEHGFQSVSLGTARLRTETAGVVACHLVNLIND